MRASRWQKGALVTIIALLKVWKTSLGPPSLTSAPSHYQFSNFSPVMVMFLAGTFSILANTLLEVEPYINFSRKLPVLTISDVIGPIFWDQSISWTRCCISYGGECIKCHNSAWSQWAHVVSCLVHSLLINSWLRFRPAQMNQYGKNYAFHQLKSDLSRFNGYFWYPIQCQHCNQQTVRCCLNIPF